MTDDGWVGEERQQLHQRIDALERENATMKMMRTDGGLNRAALDAALRIEDLFCQDHIGGRTQRLARVQILVRETMRMMLTGSEIWSAGTDLRNATTPVGGSQSNR